MGRFGETIKFVKNIQTVSRYNLRVPETILGTVDMLCSQLSSQLSKSCKILCIIYQLYRYGMYFVRKMFNLDAFVHVF